MVGGSTNRYTHLAIVLLVWLAARVVFFEGLWGYDDLSHVRFAMQPRVPTEVFDARWPYNLALMLSLQTFAFSEWACAVPTLLSSLCMLLTVWTVAYRWLGAPYDTLGALLVALLTLDVTQSTVPMATPLAAAFAGAGTVLLLDRRSLGSALTAGSLLGLAISTHMATAFYFGPLLVVQFFVPGRRWLRSATLLLSAIAVFAAVEAACGMWFAGDPLHRFHIISDTHLSTQVRFIPVTLADGQLNPEWIMWSARAFVATRELGFTLCLAVAGTIVVWRRREKHLGALLGLVLFAWLYINFGTQHPTQYAPLDHQIRYWYPLLVPLCLLTMCVAKHLEPHTHLRRWYLAALFVPLPFLLTLAGPWGQNVEVSRALAEHARSHADENFVTDVRTWEELYVLLGCRNPENVSVFPDVESPITSVPASNRLGADSVLLINPMNLGRTGTEKFALIAAKLKWTEISEPAPRPLFANVPREWLRDRPFVFRRPAAAVAAADQAHAAGAAVGLSPPPRH